MAFLVHLADNLTSSIQTFLGKLKAEPLDVWTLDKDVGDQILALHDKVFVTPPPDAESDDEDEYVRTADLNARMNKMDEEEVIEWNVLAKFLLKCDFPRFLQRWIDHLFGRVIGRTKIEILTRDLKIVHRALHIFNVSLGRSRFLRKGLASTAENDDDDDDELDVVPFPSSREQQRLLLRRSASSCGGYEAKPTIGLSAPLHFILANLPTTLTVAAGNLLVHTPPTVDPDRVTFLLLARFVNPECHSHVVGIARQFVDSLYILVTAHEKGRYMAFLQDHTPFLSDMHTIILEGGLFGRDAMLAAKLLRLYLRVTPQERRCFGRTAGTEEGLLLEQVVNRVRQEFAKVEPSSEDKERLKVLLFCLNLVATVKANLTRLADLGMHEIYMKAFAEVSKSWIISPTPSPMPSPSTNAKKSVADRRGTLGKVVSAAVKNDGDKMDNDTLELVLRGLIKMTFNSKVRSKIVNEFDSKVRRKLEDVATSTSTLTFLDNKDEGIKKLLQLFLFQMEKTPLFKELAIQSERADAVEKLKTRRKQALQELWQKEGKYVRDMEMACVHFRPRVEAYHTKTFDAFEQMKGMPTIASNVETLETLEEQPKNAKKVLDVIDLMKPILEIHRDIVFATIDHCYNRVDELNFLDVASCLLHSFDKHLDKMKEAYKTYVPKCIEAKEIVVRHRRERYEPMRKEIAAGLGLEDEQGKDPNRVGGLHLIIELPKTRMMQYKQFFQSIIKYTRDLQEIATVEKMENLIARASELPVFVNMHLDVSLIDGDIGNCGEITFRDEFMVISDQESDFVSPSQNPRRSLTNKKRAIGFIFEKAIVFCEKNASDDAAVTTSKPLTILHKIDRNRLRPDPNVETTNAFALTNEVSKKKVWVETNADNFPTWRNMLKEVERKHDHLLSTIMAPGKPNLLVRGSDEPDPPLAADIELEPPMPKDEMNRLLQLGKKEAIILTEERALPTAYFLLAELTKKGRSVELIYRAETAADYDAFAEKVTESNALIVVARNTIDHLMTRCFLHFASARNKKILLVNADANANLTGWINSFIRDHAVSFLPESPMEVPRLAQPPPQRGKVGFVTKICDILENCKDQGSFDAEVEKLEEPVDRWSSEMVETWSKRFPDNVADFFKGCDGKAIVRIAEAMNANDGEKLVDLLTAIHRRHVGEKDEPTDRGDEMAPGKEVESSMSLTIPLAVVGLKRHFLDLIAVEASKRRSVEEDVETRRSEEVEPRASQWNAPEIVISEVA